MDEGDHKSAHVTWSRINIQKRLRGLQNRARGLEPYESLILHLASRSEQIVSIYVLVFCGTIRVVILLVRPETTLELPR